ncbi:MAG: hypothetical protein QOK27_2667 [Gemmatimonadales bacterium]|jgi:hypothetical protein|nr:hypothetical protein [Gemmatimonadales bacterium]
MSYKFKLSRRTARLRALTAAASLIAAVACNPEEAIAPIVDGGATPETPAAPTLEAYTSATAPGIAFGDFHLPTSLFSSSRYSGSLQAVALSTVYSELNTAARYGKRLVISMAGSRKFYTNSNGTFNMTKWKNRVSAFRGVALGRYVSSGVLLGHYLVDEPQCLRCWGGQRIPASAVEEMARYSKSIWPSLPTTVRAAPTLLPLINYRYLDFAWAQWVGPHVPSANQTPAQFRDRQTAAARARGLGLVFGLNYLSGGNGSSGRRGTATGRWEMSAREVKNVGTVLAQAGYACAMLSWQYSSTFVSRTGMGTALSAVSTAARNRSRTSCKK